MKEIQSERHSSCCVAGASENLSAENAELNDLKQELSALYAKKELDAFCLYL